jgi:hypothetical protein
LISKWELGIDSTDDFTTDVQKWFGAYSSVLCSLLFLQLTLQHVPSLDTMGIAGFSHDFGALDEKMSPVARSFQEVADAKPGLTDAVILFLSPAIHALEYLPTNRQSSILSLRESCRNIAKHIMKEAEVDEKAERSILALLGKSFG